MAKKDKDAAALLADQAEHEPTEEDVKIDPDDVSIEALDGVDLFLPTDFEDEIFAAEVLENISTYHKSEAARRAARHAGKHELVAQLEAQALVSRTAAALIQHEHPNTRELYKELAQARTIQIRKARAAFLEGDKE